MDEMGHTNPNLALSIYRQTMRRDEQDKARSRLSSRATQRPTSRARARWGLACEPVERHRAPARPMRTLGAGASPLNRWASEALVVRAGLAHRPRIQVVATHAHIVRWCALISGAAKHAAGEAEPFGGLVVVGAPGDAVERDAVPPAGALVDPSALPGGIAEEHPVVNPPSRGGRQGEPSPSGGRVRACPGSPPRC